MKEKLLKNKKKIVTLLTVVLLLSTIGLCSWGIPVLLENSQEENNNIDENETVNIEPATNEDINEDYYNQENGLKDFIKVTYNDYNGKDYSFSLDNEDISVTKIGMQISTKDYVYTYGYYWTENDAKIVPRDNSLDGWSLQESDIGWGVAVKDRSKESYEGIYNTIAGEPVTWLNGTFYNCVNMTTMPMLPNNAKHTDYMFFNCKSLQSAVIPTGITTIGTAMFYKCTSLMYTHLPKTINSIAVNGYSGYEASLYEEEVLESCKDVMTLKLPTSYTSDAGYTISLVPYEGVLVRQNSSYYFISAMGPNFIKIDTSGLLSFRSEGSDGNGLEMYYYNEEMNKWEQILFYPGGYGGTIPSYQNGLDPFYFSDIVYTSEDLYKDGSNEIYRKADTKNWYDGIYYGYESDLFGAFKDCNSKVNIYCEHKEAPEQLNEALKGKTVFFDINFVQMMRIKHDEFNDK